MADPSETTKAAIIDSLTSQFRQTHSLLISRSWLSSNLTPRQLTTNPSSLFATFEYRFKASDLTLSLEPSNNNCLPPDIVNKHKLTIPHHICLQVVDIWDMGSSLIDTLDRIEMAERGEVMKGKEIVRVVQVDNDNNNSGGGGEDGSTPQQPVQSGAGVSTAKSVGPHKLLLEDARGERCYAFENKRVDKIELAMSMGSKLMVHNVKVLRGVLLLEPANTTFLGGKIDEWQKTHLETRKEKLKTQIQALRDERN